MNANSFVIPPLFSVENAFLKLGTALLALIATVDLAPLIVATIVPPKKGICDARNPCLSIALSGLCCSLQSLRPFRIRTTLEGVLHPVDGLVSPPTSADLVHAVMTFVLVANVSPGRLSEVACIVVPFAKPIFAAQMHVRPAFSLRLIPFLPRPFTESPTPTLRRVVLGLIAAIAIWLEYVDRAPSAEHAPCAAVVGSIVILNTVRDPIGPSIWMPFVQLSANTNVPSKSAHIAEICTADAGHVIASGTALNHAVTRVATFPTMFPSHSKNFAHVFVFWTGASMTAPFAPAAGIPLTTKTSTNVVPDIPGRDKRGTCGLVAICSICRFLLLALFDVLLNKICRQESPDALYFKRLSATARWKVGLVRYRRAKEISETLATVPMFAWCLVEIVQDLLFLICRTKVSGRFFYCIFRTHGQIL